MRAPFTSLLERKEGMRIKQFLVLSSALAIGVVLGHLGNALVRADDERGAGKTSIYNLDNCVTEFSEDRVERTEKGWRFWFVAQSVSKTFNFNMSNVKGRSANHAAHTHGEEEIFYVFEGTAKFTLNGESKIVGPNSTLFCPAGVSHGIFNAGDTPLRYAVIKANYPASNE